ncbi:MAG: hypothetical protein KGJ62_01020 [Armatimonadetes bacterium]|nr:hypothetical protein [Armatimonadota bacterium]MDE2207781.1 hypothetical protein [Armatimonadota bacterium]
MAVLTLGAATVARAQGGPYWKISNTYVKALAWSTTRYGVTHTGTNTLPNSDVQMGGSGYTNVKLVETIQVTPTLSWVNADGSPGVNPPSPVYVAEHGYSFASGIGATLAATADDGLSDTEVAQNPGELSEGIHLIQRQGGGGTITLPAITVTTTADVSDTGYALAEVSWSFSVYIDTRGVTISSTNDPTYHRVVVNGAPTRVMDLRNADGSLDCNMVDSQDGFQYDNYFANPWGAWHTNSTYAWTESTNGDNADGTFGGGANPGGIDETYVDTTKGGEDQIILALVDPSDGAQCKNNYMMHFHDKYEDWVKTSQVDYPAPNPTNTNHPGWTIVGESTNNTSLTQTYTVTISQSATMTESGTVGTEFVTQIGDPAAYLQFKINDSITCGSQITASLTQSISVSVEPYATVYVFTAPIYSDLYGTCSLWDAHGYNSDVAWSGVFCAGGVLQEASSND